VALSQQRGRIPRRLLRPHTWRLKGVRFSSSSSSEAETITPFVNAKRVFIGSVATVGLSSIGGVGHSPDGSGDHGSVSLLLQSRKTRSSS
jgi:hypothetical protein